MIVPCIGLTRVLHARWGGSPRCDGNPAPFGPLRSCTAAQAGRHDHLEPFPAHLDRQPLRSAGSDLERPPPSPARASACRTRSRSSGCAPAAARRRTRGRPPRPGGRGSTVGIPPTSNSASARAERCSASARLAPVTISLANQRVVHLRDRVIRPRTWHRAERQALTGVPRGDRARGGQELRPGSSALIRNSIECPGRAGRRSERLTSAIGTSPDQVDAGDLLADGCSTWSLVLTSRS